MKLNRRVLLWGGAGVAAAGFLAYSFRPTPVPIEVATVARGPMRVTIDEEGRTRVRDRYVVVAPAAGRVARIALDEGAPATRGAASRRSPGSAGPGTRAGPRQPRSRRRARPSIRPRATGRGRSPCSR